MLVHGFADSRHVKREKAKARVLRKSQWWKRQLAQGQCHYCGDQFSAESLTMDHRVPLSRGGLTSRGNVVTCCKECNSRKKFYTPAEMILQQSKDTLS